MSGTVDDVDIDDVKTLAAHQRRQKAMQPVEIRHHQEYLAAERLQATAGIAGAVVQNGVADAIGGARLQLLETGVLASDPLAGGKTDAVAAVLDRRNQVRQERWIVLPVAVERRHDGSPRG